MVLNVKRMVMELEYRGITSVQVGAGSGIDCVRGRIWITEQGGTDDIVLEAGDSYEFARSGVAVVQALREAMVGLRAPELRCGDGIAARLVRFWRRSAALAAGVG